MSTTATGMQQPHVPQRRKLWPHLRLAQLFVCGLLSLPACVLQCGAASSEYFSSVDSLQMLGDVELSLAAAFRQFFDMQEKEFANYRKFIEHVKTQHDLASKDVEEYLGNPINAFTLIKRMVTDWDHLHQSIANSKARDALKAAADKLDIPDEYELSGAVNGIARLQEIYDLSAADLVEGNIAGVYHDTELTWQECYEIATNLFESKQYKYAVDWFEVTLELLEDAPEDNNLLAKYEHDSLEYLALALYEIGDSEKALNSIDVLLEMSPEHPIKDTKYYIERSVPRHIAPVTASWFQNFKNLCRGKRTADPELERKLKCVLTTEGKRPTLLLAPLRKEEISLDPEISLYHGLLTDAQIEQVLLVAESKMKRATVVKEGDVQQRETTEARISKTAWLPYDIPLLENIRNLVADVSGLNTGTSDNFQVATYGIAGQYNPHFDFFSTDQYATGNRIATNMFYLSDVEQGGYTVFPNINVYLKPTKGAMVMWYNLHRSLDRDFRMLHAACPVVKGTKRIANIWTHTHLQEFRRPCLLRNDKNKSAKFN